MYNSCNKRINCRDILYSFQTNIKAFPDLDSLNINDTIWLEFSCSTQLADLNSGQSIDYSGAENFGTAIGIV